MLEARRLKSVALGRNQGVGRAVPPLEALVENSSIPCLLQLLVAAGIPWLVATSLHSSGQRPEILFCSVHTVFSLFVSKLPLSFKKDIYHCI